MKFDKNTHTMTFDTPKEAVEKLSVASKAIKARSENNIDNFISVDCKIESARTDWEKKELHLSLATKHEDTEYEAEQLGEIARMENSVCVLIYQVNERIEDAVKFNAFVDGVRLDWKIEKLVITLTVDGLSDELVNTALRLGVMAHMEFPCTAHFESSQPKLL